MTVARGWHSAADMDRPPRPVNAAPRPPRNSRGRALALAALLALPLLALPGCSVFQAPTVQRGNRITEEQLKEITPGVQTRQDVQAVLGSPTPDQHLQRRHMVLHQQQDPAAARAVRCR